MDHPDLEDSEDGSECGEEGSQCSSCATGDDDEEEEGDSDKKSVDELLSDPSLSRDEVVQLLTNEAAFFEAAIYTKQSPRFFQYI